MPPRISSCTRTNSRTDKGGSDLGWSALLSDRKGFCRRNVQQLGSRYAATTTHVSKIRPTLSFAVTECSGVPMNETPVMSVSCRSPFFLTWKPARAIEDVRPLDPTPKMITMSPGVGDFVSTSVDERVWCDASSSEQQFQNFLN